MRVSTNVARHRKRQRILKQASGFRGTSKNRLRRAKDGIQRAMNYAYNGRKQKKREYRALFITRITAACMPLGVKYSELIALLAKAGIGLDRKSLSELAIHDNPAFAKVVAMAQAAK